MFVPDKIAIPVPVFVKLLVPLITPLNVICVPSTSRSVSANNWIGPANVLVPVEAEILPEFLNVSVVE